MTELDKFIYSFGLAVLVVGGGLLILYLLLTAIPEFFSSKKISLKDKIQIPILIIMAITMIIFTLLYKAVDIRHNLEVDGENVTVRDSMFLAGEIR